MSARKRKREVERMRREAAQLWAEQQAALERANRLARQAGRHIGSVSREEVFPRVQRGYEHYVRPGVEWAGDVAHRAGARIERDVLPAVGKAIGTALAVGDVAREARIQKTLSRVHPALAPARKKSSSGFWVVAAVVAVIGAIGFAVFQTLRADDELWTADDSDVPN